MMSGPPNARRRPFGLAEPKVRIRRVVTSVFPGAPRTTGPGKADRPPRPMAREPSGQRPAPAFEAFLTNMDHKSDQANRAISTSQLNTSPRLHSWPINVVVFHGSQGRTRFKVGFPLRCLQRLSRPYIATLHCGWRHNSSTRGTSIPVLSY